MANLKFVTMKGGSALAAAPYYVGLVQHERTMSRKESYDYLAERIGYRAAAVRAVFMALKEYVRENADRGNITYLDGVASIRNFCRGAFATSTGPWVRGVNGLVVAAVELDPFKGVLAGVIPTNNTDGANPVINTVLDETTLEYDVITGTDLFSVAGSDLGPDTSKDDEYVALISASGVETKCTVAYSDLGNVKAQLVSPLEAGTYTLAVFTRSGLGGEYGVRKATRKVKVA